MKRNYKHHDVNTYYKALNMFKEGKRFVDISRELHISVSTVRGWLQRGQKPIQISEKWQASMEAVYERNRQSGYYQRTTKNLKLTENYQKWLCSDAHRAHMKNMQNKSAELITKKIDNNAFEITEDLAFILGTIYGDGHIRKSQNTYYTICLNVIDEDFVLEFARAVKDQFKLTSVITKCSIKKYSPNWNDQFKLACYSKLAATYLKQFDINILKTYSMKIKAGFVRGFFDSEGHVRLWHDKKLDIYNRDITITNKSLELILFVNELLGDLNIDCKILKRTSMTRISKQVFDCYDIKIYGIENIILFQRLIGSSIKRKRDKLDELIDSFRNAEHQRLANSLKQLTIVPPPVA